VILNAGNYKQQAKLDPFVISIEKLLFLSAFRAIL